MAAVTIPHSDPWIVARWAFQRLLEHASGQMSDHRDRQVLEQAAALDGLHFDLLDSDQARRIAQIMRISADELRFELLAGDQADPRDAEFADALAVLEMRLHDVHE